MHLAEHIIARAVEDHSVKPFTDAGFGADWLACEESAPIFSGIYARAWAYLLRHAADIGRVPPLELLRHEFPESNLRLPADPMWPAELIEIATTESSRTIIQFGQMQLQDILARDSVVQGDRESVDDAAAVLAGMREKLDRIIGPAGDFEFKAFADLDPTPVTYWIDGLWARGGHMLFSGYGKVGKTTLLMYLLKALTQTGVFLGRRCRLVDGTIVYLNLEMDEAMLRKYAEDAGLDLENKHLRVLQLRGQVSRLKIREARFRRSFARQLQDQQCEILVTDTLSPLMLANQFDADKEGRACLELMGEIAAEVKCDHSAVDHTGHDNRQRARNDSGKQDQVDVKWNAHAPREGETQRVLTASGRGVSTRAEYLMNADGQIEEMPDPDGPGAGQPKTVTRARTREAADARRDDNLAKIRAWLYDPRNTDDGGYVHPAKVYGENGTGIAKSTCSPLITHLENEEEIEGRGESSARQIRLTLKGREKHEETPQNIYAESPGLNGNMTNSSRTVARTSSGVSETLVTPVTRRRANSSRTVARTSDQMEATPVTSVTLPYKTPTRRSRRVTQNNNSSGSQPV